jgi:hypothetical protein
VFVLDIAHAHLNSKRLTARIQRQWNDREVCNIHAALKCLVVRASSSQIRMIVATQLRLAQVQARYVYPNTACPISGYVLKSNARKRSRRDNRGLTTTSFKLQYHLPSYVKMVDRYGPLYYSGLAENGQFLASNV